MNREQQKAMFAKKWNQKSLESREKMLEDAKIFTSYPKFVANKKFENLDQSYRDMLLMKAGINVNKKVNYGYKLKSQYDPKHPLESDIHYHERTGQILSSRKWSNRKKHMVHYKTGQDYAEW